jgi:hypothetical protein
MFIDGPRLKSVKLSEERMSLSKDIRSSLSLTLFQQLTL